MASQFPFRGGMWVSLGVLVFLMAGECRAQTETQHLLEFPWQISPRLNLVLHSRVRTRPGVSGLYQARGGAFLESSIHPSALLITGFYYREEQSGADEWDAWSRYFGGVEHVLYRWRGTWSARHLVEVFDAPDRANFYRVRHRAGWEAPWRVAPFADAELLWDRSGWRSSRWQAGTVVQLNRRLSWDVHYFYEPRRDRTARHMWGTTLEIRLDSVEPSSARPEQGP